MRRALAPRVRVIIALSGLLAAATTSLSACAPTSCSAAKVADNFTVIAVGTMHTHPLLSLCEAAICTPPLNASSDDRGASVNAVPSLALDATSIDHWRISVGENKNGDDANDPSSVSVALCNRTTPPVTRTIHPSWHPAPGPCSSCNSANTERIAVP